MKSIKLKTAIRRTYMKLRLAKKNINILLSIITVITLLFITTQASARSLSLSGILDHIDQLGYQNITEIEHDDGILKIKGIDKNGATYKLSIDPSSGEIISNARYTKPKLTINQIVKQLESKGYKNINEIELKRGVYKVKVKNSLGKKQKLYISTSTGTIQNND